ncbi:MAG: 50S ribosomal protein L18a [Candidatus Thermoplasmatota archaeon]|nr:50S ribosomal protein L18a [Euryarchaeota archaeon]MBU4031721.1 50S ribosomal protein L18a [Candidatus Thermoplasmatota archaeon]MBU4070753.1 50S ribosomal protein L18a [Candidatus Thermoplasmatota archaeon]MBU4144738.1 50S ribosomal protein L18a [Candidatus Thermoplasmatota archaeon]MBU4592840.1 50S ribosomal protein L18a [Candidatus Thermoplasmatota archaeon]
MKAFKVTGTFQMGRMTQHFSKEVISKDKNGATETILSDLGSKHKVKRYQISIKEVVELKPEDITDTIVSHKLGEI